MKTAVIVLLTTSFLYLAMPTTFAAIQYGSTTKEAPFAASTTKQVGDLLNSAVGTDPAVVDAPGILHRIGQFFVGINTWLHDNAGIDLFSILKGIGHLFLIVIQFVVDLLRKVL